MKTLFYTIALISLGTLASADLPIPTAAYIHGEEAKQLQQKIIEVTEQTPREFRGRKTVVGDAKILCVEDTTTSVICSIDIKKNN